MPYFKYKIVHLDNVMGECGWEVNDAHFLGDTIELHHKHIEDDKLLVAELRDAGFLPPRTKYTQIDVEGNDGFSIWLRERKSGMWLYELRPIDL